VGGNERGSIPIGEAEDHISASSTTGRRATSSHGVSAARPVSVEELRDDDLALR
jgi:hypothetical protein